VVHIKIKENVSTEKHSLPEVARNATGIVIQRKMFFIIALFFFGALFSFFYGVYIIPFLEIGFIKMTPNGPLDYVYVVVASFLSALIVTLFRHSLSNRATSGASGVGMVGGAFGAVCPSCLGINAVVFGNVFAAPLAFLIPYLKYIQFGSLGLMMLGVWFSAKNASDKSCMTCNVSNKIPKSNGLFTKKTATYYLSYALIGVASLLLIYQISSFVSGEPASAGTDSNGVIADVLPEEGFTINAVWGDNVANMVGAGVLDPVKLENILTSRYGQQMKPEWRGLLEAPSSNEKLKIDAENSVFMMYLLWTFAKHNDVPIIHNSRFASSFKNYDIGVGRAGYGDVKLLELTPAQLAVADKVAQNSYRPCCGQSAANPDCSHGYSALGLMELMASQGYTEKEIFDAFVKFNSFWFPSTYIQNALYFELVEGKSWSEADKELVAGQQFSSLSGSYQVKKKLEELGI
jgi:hypothetical protein